MPNWRPETDPLVDLDGTVLFPEACIATVYGIKVFCNDTVPPDRIFYDGFEFKIHPGRYKIADFYSILSSTRKAKRMEATTKMSWPEARAEYDRVFDLVGGAYLGEHYSRDSAHGRTVWNAHYVPALRADAPTHWPYEVWNDDPPSDGTPFQEMAEKLEQRISELEDIQAKGLAVIDAFVKRETELVNDVYQAQLDAQDWQNRYNDLKADVNNGYTSLINDRDAARAEAGRLESRLYDEIRDCADWRKKWQTDNDVCAAAEQALRSKRGQVEHLSKRIGHLVAELQDLRGRVSYLTAQNTDLELRNERQANRISSAKKWLDGTLDSIH